MRNIKVILEYDGTAYGGWQKQKNAMTVQQCIEDAIFKITSEQVEVIGSSRTDAGVHAKGFVANFTTESIISAERFQGALNSKLPKDIVVIHAEEMPLDFHARYGSKGKTYSYTVLNRVQPPAMERNFVHHVKWELNIEHMIEGGKLFLGKQDFAAFRNMGSSVKTTTRTIQGLSIEQKNDKVYFYITADGFLYNMVRIIVGTLLEVGLGRKKPEDIKKIIESKDRKNAGNSAPAQGLCLEKVYY